MRRKNGEDSEHIHAPAPDTHPRVASGSQKHAYALSATFNLAMSWEDLAYSGQDRFGGTSGLPNVQLCDLAAGRSASAILNNGKDRSTDKQTTNHCNNDHGFDLYLQKVK
jgi:hypothetical protein